jgi:hypothetical protein
MEIMVEIMGNNGVWEIMVGNNGVMEIMWEIMGSDTINFKATLHYPYAFPSKNS